MCIWQKEKTQQQKRKSNIKIFELKTGPIAPSRMRYLCTTEST